MWYILLATAFIFVLDATTGLQHGILLQILLSFTLIFHLWSIMIGGNRGMLLFRNFSIFGFMRVIFSVLNFSIFGFPTNKNYVCRHKI